MIPGLQYYEERFKVYSEPIIKPGLTSMQQALLKLGNPQEKVRFVHIAGTNGKGSTVTFVESLALAHGLKVGAFLSPAIESVHDQLRINGKAITKEQMEAVFERLQVAEISGMCTEFELLTCAAFVLFEILQVDLAVVEAGMGGRFDSTNVLTPIVSIIPSIALEHTNFLGDTIAKIAWHKAGIVKKCAPVVVGDVDAEALKEIQKEAELVGAEVEQFEQVFTLQNGRYQDTHYTFEEITPCMLGTHQIQNAALAIRAFTHCVKELVEANVQQAIGAASLPFRFERVAKSIYFDGAHNPASAIKLVATIQEQFSGKPVQFVVGMLADKDVTQVLEILQTVSDDFVFVDFDNERAMLATQILEKSTASQKRIESQIVDYLIQQQLAEKITIVTGSLYLLASIRAQFLQRVE